MNSPGSPNLSAGKRGFHNSSAATLRRAWQEGREPALDTFIAGIPDATPSELAALIRVDFDARWKRNDPQRPEEYLSRFSAVAADSEAAVDVIYAEYLAREASGERPELKEYQQRFPEYAEVLAEQIQLHLALEAFEDDTLLDPDAAQTPDAGLIESSNEQSNLDATYEILEQIGSGGMGVVYKARQPGLNRFVALKMVRAIDAGNPELLARFRSEARVVAALHHQNIVQVYDYGQHDDLPYIAMELIEGGSLAERLDGKPWNPRTAAELIVKLAGAVQFAHDHGVIHRDLKPPNVLVVSDVKGLEVKVTDFGLAKFYADHSSSHTKSIAFLGTPSYMAPEQASGRARDAGPATDIYSLGAILYELLTGQPPFRGESPIETLRLLLSTEPVSIHRLTPNLSRDLATICHKCLQVDINKRYASAAELRADLERYLEGKPIQSRPIGNVERAWRWCRRNPYLATSLGSVAMLLVGIAGVSLWYSTQLSRELIRTQLLEQAEREANQSAQQRLWNVYLSEATARNNSRQVGQRFAALETIDKAIALLDSVGRTSEREFQLRNAVLSSIALPDMRIVRSIGQWPKQEYATTLAASANLYAIATQDGTITGYRLSDDRQLWTTEPHDPRVMPIVSQDAHFVAAVGPRGAKVWRVDEPQPRLAWEAPRAEFFSFLPDGKHALYSDLTEGMLLVDVSDGTVVRRIGNGTARSPFAFHSGTKNIAVFGKTGVQLIAAGTGAIEAEFPMEPYVEGRLAWHPSGEFLAVWLDDREFSLWNVKTRTKLLSFSQVGNPELLFFNRDGTLLVSQSKWNQRLFVWDIGSGQRFLEVPEFTYRACDVGSNGQIQFLTSGDATLTELSVGVARSMAQSIYVPLTNWQKASISPEGRIVAFGSMRGFELWDLQTTRRLLVREIGPCMAEFERSGRLIVACNAGVFRLSPRVETIAASAESLESDPGFASSRTVMNFGAAEQLMEPVVPLNTAMSAKGETLLFQDEQGWAIKHIDKDDKITRLQTKGDPRCSDVSNNNRFAAAANWESGGATVWDAQSGKLAAKLAIGRYGVVKFSPDGRLLAATPDGITLWNTSDWSRINELHAQGTTPTGLGLAFSPDSRVLAVGHVNGALGLVDPLTGKQWAYFSRWDLSAASTIAFSSDQQWLVTSSMDERSPAQVWDLVTMRRELSNRGLDLPANVLRATAGPQNFEEHIEVVLDFDGMLDAR